MDSLHNDWGFHLSAEDFAERLMAEIQQLQGEAGEYTAQIVSEDGKAQLNIVYTEFGFRETAAELTWILTGRIRKTSILRWAAFWMRTI